MSNFRTKILGLAAMATAFVGVSYGQVVVCAAGTNAPATGTTAPPAAQTNLGNQVNPSLRAESQTEMLAVYQFNCTVITGTPAAPVAPAPSASTTGTVFVNTNLPITSKALTGGANEATIIINGTTTAVAANGQITLGNGSAIGGTVTGNQVSFLLTNCTVGTAACPIPNFPAVGVFEVTNIRVNASSAGSPQTTEGGLLSYIVPTTTQGLVTANLALPSANGPGYILKSLTNLALSSVSAPYTTCGGNATGISFYMNVNQLIPDPFLGVGTAASTLPGSEVGQYVSASTGTANADTVVFTINNLPASATVYVPQVVTGSFTTPATLFGTAGPPANTFTLTLVGSTPATGAITGTIATPVAFTPTSGTVTITYTVSVAGGGDQTTVTGTAAGGGSVPNQIPVVVAFAANSATAQTAITANYFYGATAAALTGPATAVPTFAPGSLASQNGPTIINCQTSLLFPFVTNQVGFDTGIVFANTSVDNLGNAPLFTKSFAAAQAGTCQMFFYGTTAPTPAGPIADPQGSLAAGNVHAFQLSAVASGYQGYMIAVCPFQYGHGFAFLTNAGTAGTSAVTQGYLAEVLGFGDRTQVTADGGITF